MAPRYHGYAIALHWVIAFLIIGMLGVGIFMTGLEESEPLRFALTQWHKSFGVVALFLIVGRLAWRLNHTPPRLPDHLAAWEIRAAGIAHLLLYLLILMIPLSGWIMVSASPLDLPTLIFDGIHWPHLPPFDRLPSKAEISALFAEIHAYAAYALILVLVAHIGAALRHRFVLRDDVMSRMSPTTSDGRWAVGVLPLIGTIVVIIALLIAYGLGLSGPPPLAAGASRVDFEFTVDNQASRGSFVASKVELVLDPDNPAANRLVATVDTSSVATGTSQIDSTLKASDWFDVDNHPQAIFESSSLLPEGENRYAVSGVLTIKGIGQELRFSLTLEQAENGRRAVGGFTIARLDFGLGAESQPDDETVGLTVPVEFEFEVQ